MLKPPNKRQLVDGSFWKGRIVYMKAQRYKKDYGVRQQLMVQYRIHEKSGVRGDEKLVRVLSVSLSDFAYHSKCFIIYPIGDRVLQVSNLKQITQIGI